ncbi:MAG TPA: pantoate--beta-alanine ligase [Xanthobacteraceae bacterium]|nr:pantoate--beta-alanine ligase [Xanthobacteraceae bacterium]
MQTVRDSEELTRRLADLRRNGTIALVPTMGALHAGHVALIAEARRHADTVVATIFVNPTQFNDPADLARYPRSEAEDARKLEDAGCDLLWMPGASDIYPQGFATTVHVAGISERWEGEARPGHFDGVATVVAKLLLAVRPDVARFGEKDFQQLAVIRRMVTDLGIGVEILGAPTVRDADGLALSSRNALLSAEQRKAAVALPRALDAARNSIAGGTDVSQALDSAKQALSGAGFSRIDYFALVDASTLEPLDQARGAARLLAAAVIGTTRLIDNLAI